MFPTFISILDIQSWWEVPSIAHFCSLFRAAFNLLDFDIEDLEEALLTDGTEETSWLQELIVRLLSGCLANNEISTFNYQMFLRRLFRQKCQEHDRYNPFNTDIDFQFLPLRTKVEILQALCDFRLDADDVLDHLKNLEADSLRVEPLGYDDNESAYWYFYGTRLYREDFTFKNNKKVKCVWQVICFTEDDWYQLARKFRKSSSKAERQLYRTLSENFQPELPRLFQEKEVLHRKRLLEWLPRRTSTRLDVKRQQNKEPESSEPPDEEDRESTEDSKSRKKHRSSSVTDKGKRRNSNKETAETQPVSAATDGKQEVKRHAVEMAERRKQRELRSLNREKTKEFAAAAGSTSPVKGKGTAAANMPGLTTVGRQTNNSLASATGQIVIQSVSNPNRKKLKTSQVFRQSEEDLQTGMYKILEAVKNQEDAWPFVEPVEEEYAPNYYTIIRRPMDLQRMEDKLDSGHYMSFSKFKQDFQLIVDNCRLYNGTENEYSEMVENLLEAFQRATDRYLDQITSSDEEIAVEFQERKDARSSSTTGPLPTTTTVTPTNQNKRKKSESTSNSGPKRKPTSMAHVADKRDRSASVESSQRSESPETKPEKNKVTTRGSKVISNKTAKNTKNDIVKNIKRDAKRNKKAQSPSPERSRSRSPKRTSRSPSWPPSSPEHWKSAEKRDTSPTVTKAVDTDDEKVAKAKGKHKHWKEVFKDKKKLEKEVSKPKEIPKHKDKNIKLKETIEKLKAKNDLLISEDGILKTKNNDKPKVKPVEKEPIKEEKLKLKDKINKKPVINKTKLKQPIKNKNPKSQFDFDDEGSTKDSSISKKGPKKPVKKAPVKNVADIDALAIATEQTLKDINKWLDDAPRFSEFSSASNSPAHFIGAEETDPVATKIDQEYRKSLKMDKPLAPTRPRDPKDIFKRRTTKDPSKLHRRKEVQRTIDRLQPGKSKGNLILNIQNTNKPEELFPLGPLSKLRESKNSLTVKTNDAAPKLSLGSVLDTFGQQHNFNEVEEKPKEIETTAVEEETASTVKPESTDDKKEDEVKKDEIPVKADPIPEKKEPKVENKATPNLSAWFKAFGAPKVQAQPKKKPEVEDEKKETIDLTQDVPAKPAAIPVEPPQPQPQQKQEEARKVISPEPESPAGGVPRQRRGSTGSSISERSSFSQDMDSSPRMSIDERIGVYPAPYPSPLHRSPAGASPVMASPRQEEPQRPPYPTLNGSIRVGFYQDTVSTKSSPDKSCSPRDQPQSPYAQYSEHVYPNTSTNAGFSYSNPPYYSQNPPPAYANTNPSSAYGERNPPTYYDTTKPLTDQYNAKVPTAFPVEDTASNPEPEYKTPVPPVEPYRRVPEKQATMFPVKKRLYSENELNRIEPPIPRSEEIQQIEQIDLTDSNDFAGARSIEMGLMTGRQLNISTGQQQQQQQPQQQQHPSPGLQELRPEVAKQYITPPQPEIRNESPNFPRSDSRGAIKPYDSQIDMTNRDLELNMAIQPNPAMRPMNFATTTTTNMYLQNHDNAYTLNMSVNNRNMESRPQESDERKLDMSKLTNMGYLPPQTNVDISRNPQYQSLNYNRPPSRPDTQQNPEHMNLMRYQDSRGVMGYRMDPPRSEPQAQPEMLQVPQRPITTMASRMDMSSGNYKAPDMNIPRPTFNTPSSLGMDQSLSLRGNLANLSHIVDRYQQDERLLNSLQTSTAYYSDKSQHMFAKGIPSSNAVTSSLQMFSQPMSYGQQTPTSLAFTRTMTELQNHAIMVQAGKNQMQHQAQQVQQQQQQQQQQIQQQQQTQPVQVEKKSSGRKRKTKQQPQQVAPVSDSSQGFQSYAGLKNAEPSAISLKTASIVPGSAFNFGPTATGLGLSTGLYGDKDGYSGFLDEYRPATNYYMAAAAHAHRTTPETTTDKPARAAHQQTPGPTPSFPFLGHPQPRAPGYPSLASPFMNPHQPPLMDPSSPLYQQYLHSAGVLHQGLLAPPTGYPPGYHPALSMRQPYDSMPRPSWL